MASISDPRPLGLTKCIVFREIALTGSEEASDVPAGPTISVGSGDPNGSLTRPQGSLFLRKDGAANTTASINTDGSTAWSALSAADADLTALAALATTGMVARTGAGTYSTRTITAPAAGISVSNGDGVAGNPTLALADDLAALEALDATAGLLAKTAADTYARRTIVATSPSIVVANGAGTAGNPGIDTAQDIRTTASPQFVGLHLTGDLVVDGSTIQVDAETVLMRANYELLNVDYVTAAAQPGGIVVNYLPTATVDATTGAGVVTAGVDGVSDPTITTDGAATFAATDIVQISGSANNGENDGLYEVLSHAANLLTLKSTSNGVSNRVEGFTRDQLVANAGDTGMALTKVTVAVIRAGSDGLWEVGSGSQTGIVYRDIYSVGGTDVAVADGGTGASNAADARVNLDLEPGVDIQAYDADLAAIAALAGTGIPSHTGAGTWSERTITGTANEITVSNGDGVAGNPTLSSPVLRALSHGAIDNPKIADGTTAGKIKTQANFGYKINGAIYSDTATDDFWDLSAESDTDGTHFRAYALEIDSSQNASFVASSDELSATLALAALAAVGATKSRIGIYIAGVSTDFNGVAGLDSYGDYYDGVPLSV